MRLRVIGSNSLGNAYILYNQNEALLIECGMHFDKIKQALNYDLAKVSGCILSHGDGDHKSQIHRLLRSGVKVFSSKGTHKQIGTYDNNNAISVEPEIPFEIGNFTVIPFDVEHDAPQPYGFLIHHNECGNVLFVTDTMYVEHTFKGLNNIIIEANYCPAKMENSSYMQFLQDRVIKSHMSIDQCKATLKANDLSGVNNIVLVHLSNANADAQRFKDEVFYLTGKTTHVAVAGLDINFDKDPF